MSDYYLWYIFNLVYTLTLLCVPFLYDDVEFIIVHTSVGPSYWVDARSSRRGWVSYVCVYIVWLESLMWNLI